MKLQYKFRIGVGTIVTLLLAIVAGYMFYRNYLAPKAPIIEHQVTGSTQRGIAPVPEYLLRHQQELRLTTAQVQRITVLAKTYRKEIAPVQQRMEVAAKNFAEFAERPRENGRLSTQQINAQSAEVQQLSKVVYATRSAYWQRARSILEQDQQQRADALARQATLKDLH